MALYELDGVAPEVDPSAWIADSAQVMGRVTLAEDVSVWFGTVIRGDTESITIGRGSNIQDGTVMHADIGMPIVLGEHVTVGHKVMLHGCTIGDETLIGIGAVVLNGAKIGRNCLVGAGAGRLLSRRTGAMPRRSMAAVMGDASSSEWLTVSVRLIRSNCSAATPGRPSRALRSSASSVGQSIFSIR